MPALSSAPLDRALELMYFGHRNLVEEPDRILARRRLARVHHRVLYFVARRPGLSVGDLLGALMVTKQALHRPVRDLVAARLVAVEPDASDRRVKRLRLSPAGRRLEADLTGRQHRLLARIFTGAGPRASAGWRAVMTQLAGEAVRRPRGHDRR